MIAVKGFPIINSLKLLNKIFFERISFISFHGINKGLWNNRNNNIGIK